MKNTLSGVLDIVLLGLLWLGMERASDREGGENGQANGQDEIFLPSFLPSSITKEHKVDATDLFIASTFKTQCVVRNIHTERTGYILSGKLLKKQLRLIAL